jgi:hypothetical protein
MVRNPRLAAAWLMARATPDNRSEHLRILVSEWAVSAPNACGEWLRDQPFGPDMDHAVETFSRIIIPSFAATARAPSSGPHAFPTPPAEPKSSGTVTGSGACSTPRQPPNRPATCNRRANPGPVRPAGMKR